MPKDARRPRRPQSAIRAPYAGNIRFKSIGETDLGTTQQHVDLLLAELPHLAMAVRLLNLTDEEFEAKVRAMTPEGLASLTGFADELKGIADRHQAVVELCEGLVARVIIIVDRLVRGPTPAIAARRRKAAVAIMSPPDRPDRTC